MDFGKNIKIISKTEKVETDMPIEKKIDTRYIHRVVITENPVVNRVQDAIKWHQDNFISLRSISLKPRLYEMFLEWVKVGFAQRAKKMGKGFIIPDISKETTIVYFDVDIKKGATFQKDDMYFERYYDKDKTEAYFGPKLGKA